MAHLKRVCARFLRAMLLIPSRNRDNQPPPPLPPRRRLLEPFLCCFCVVAVAYSGCCHRDRQQTLLASLGNQRNTANLCLTEAQLFLRNIR